MKRTRVFTEDFPIPHNPKIFGNTSITHPKHIDSFGVVLSDTAVFVVVSNNLPCKSYTATIFLWNSKNS